MNDELESRVLERTAQLNDIVLKLQRALDHAEDLRAQLYEQSVRSHDKSVQSQIHGRNIGTRGSESRPFSAHACDRYFDIDHFKSINDNYGHALGDAVLRDVGNLAIGSIRGSDIACRYGGDEFFLILPDASLSSAIEKAGQLRSRVRQLQWDWPGAPLQVAISVGVAEFPRHGANAAELRQAADRALYAAKHSGRDRVIAAV